MIQEGDVCRGSRLEESQELDLLFPGVEWDSLMFDKLGCCLISCPLTIRKEMCTSTGIKRQSAQTLKANSRTSEEHWCNSIRSLVIEFGKRFSELSLFKLQRRQSKVHKRTSTTSLQKILLSKAPSQNSFSTTMLFQYTPLAIRPQPYQWQLRIKSQSYKNITGLGLTTNCIQESVIYDIRSVQERPSFQNSELKITSKQTQRAI